MTTQGRIHLQDNNVSALIHVNRTTLATLIDEKMFQLSQVLPCLDKNSPSPERRLLKGVCLELKAERKVSRLSYGGALLELLWASLHIHEGDEDYAVTRLAVLMNNSFEPTFQLLCSYFNDNKLHVQLVRGNASLDF